MTREKFLEVCVAEGSLTGHQINLLWNRLSQEMADSLKVQLEKALAEKVCVCQQTKKD